MGFLEDLKNGDIKSIIIVIFGFLLFNLYWQTSRCTKESMANVSNDIKEAVKQVYLADVEAIRNLSEVATKLQAGSLTIPGNLTVTGNILGNHIYTKTLDIKGKHGTTHFNHADKGETYLRDNVFVADHLHTQNLTTSNHIYTKTLDIKGKHGTTHFNHADKGETYLRDNVFVADHLHTKNLTTSNHTYTKTLDIKGKHGTTYFNHGDTGITYLRDDVNIAGLLTGTNFTMNTGSNQQIRTVPNSGQFVANNTVYFGEGAGGACGGHFCGTPWGGGRPK
jgi:hypothetical protein